MRMEERTVFPYLTGKVLLIEGEISSTNFEPARIAEASSRVRFVASLSKRVLGPKLLTIPLRTIRRFSPKSLISVSVFSAKEADRLETTIREKVPRKTPITASTDLNLKL
jgi:hypothetical protein